MSGSGSSLSHCFKMAARSSPDTTKSLPSPLELFPCTILTHASGEAHSRASRSCFCLVDDHDLRKSPSWPKWRLQSSEQMTEIIFGTRTDVFADTAVSSSLDSTSLFSSRST